MKRRSLLSYLLPVLLIVIPATPLLNRSVTGAMGEFATNPGKSIATSANQNAPALTFTVTSTADLGVGSLRDAIDQANLSPGPDLINFTAGLGTINVGVMTGVGLPAITETVTIDGGSPRVELNGTAAGSFPGLTIQAPGVIVRRLVINRFSLSGILIESNNCIIQDNFIGTDTTGTVALANAEGGVALDGPGNLIGGTSATERNLISGNGSAGVTMGSVLASNNTIQGNFIGTDIGGVNPLGNVGGVGTFGSASNNTIGGTAAGAGNVIAHNTNDGVNIFGGQNNAVLGNSIFGNGDVGINLSDDPGITPNDPCDGDGGSNSLQNFPNLTSASTGAASTTIFGTLDSVIGGTYRIEFFSSPTCDASGNGEGQTFIGATTVSIPGPSCVATINVTLPTAVPGGSVITATATDSANNTSEFSACVTVVAVVSDLEITKSDSPDPVERGANLTYTIQITNLGPSTDLGVTFTDPIPVGTTFVSVSSPGSCVTPPVGGTGIVTCSLGPIANGSQVQITLVVNVNAGTEFVTNTATVSGSSIDPNLATNIAFANTSTIAPSCAITCPSDIFLGTLPGSTSCGRVVTYAPTVTGCTAGVTCAPSSGSVFAVGTTSVVCSVVDGPSCSFNVTIVDETPPTITCPTGVTAPVAAGQQSAVVNYPVPTATDACSGTTTVCVPPSGSTFPLGSTLVTCTARDVFENASRCFFFVTVLDAQPPVIQCPANVNVLPPAGQSSAVVNYPAPTVSDNLPGVVVLCSPTSGSTFPQGSTTVVCTATDAGGNRASCSFTVGVGSPQAQVTIVGNRPALEFIARPTRKPPKPKNNPCSLFSIQNTGFSTLTLTLDSFARTGPDVTSGRITNTNDSRYFSLNTIVGDLTLQPVPIESVLVFQPGQGRSFCLKFSALIPALAGRTTGLAAANVLPDTVTSSVVFRQNAGANVTVPIEARTTTGVVFVNLSNPLTPPEILFTRSGDELTVTSAVFDSNLNVTRAVYEFFDSSGQVLAGPFDINLSSSISSANLVRGQSFIIDQRFSGADSNPEVASVRLTVFDGETSVSASASLSGASSAANIQLMNRARGVTLYPPAVRLR